MGLNCVQDDDGDTGGSSGGGGGGGRGGLLEQIQRGRKLKKTVTKESGNAMAGACKSMVLPSLFTLCWWRAAGNVQGAPKPKAAAAAPKRGEPSCLPACPILSLTALALSLPFCCCRRSDVNGGGNGDALGQEALMFRLCE